ncbi:membrane metallo-endopeptidase-like 1 isoform X2 [Montipora capricornis]|uniref:membrane metallo-endopeptidase-like 1 isoform X2 n=1 Tax=Montipora capricornis TaxID=246305 RepID=UPI0035F20F25
MSQYSLNSFVDETKTKSTETLGIDRNQNEEDGECKRRYIKTRKYLFVSLAIVIILLSVCIVLGVFLAVSSKKIEHPTRIKEPEDQQLPKSYCYSPECLQITADFARKMDTSINACENIFQHACGSWIRDNPIPPSKTFVDEFSVVDDKNSQRMREMLEEGSEQLSNRSAVKKVKLFYKSCQREEEVEKTAVQTLKPLIAKYGSWALDLPRWNSTKWNLVEILIAMNSEIEVFPFFALFIDIDPQNSSQFLLSIHPPELSLIREQYLAKENKTRLAYLDFMTKVGEILDGGDTTRQQMQDVMEFEGKLAEIIPPRSEIYSKYHQSMNLTELERKAPGIGFTWVRYLNSIMSQFNIRINDSDRVLVPSPEYLKNMSIIVNGTDKRTLSNYVMWTFVSSMIPYLSREFRGAFLDYQKATGGQKAAKPRWLSCVEDINSFHNGLTFALGYLWVTSSFDVEIIPFIEEMMGGIKTAFRDETPRYDWVDEQTRRKILQKEAAMKTKVGFPELCANETLLNNYYQNLSISGNYLENALGVMSWRRRNFLSRLRTPVDKQEWYTGPQIVNAFYLPSRNEINILAGILQPPFYYGRKAPRAVNYGAIGMILAHELSHGFDATGRKFNKDGEITENWWTNFTTKGFEKRAQCMVDQYNKYSVDGGERGPIQINGKLTLSENIADNGGVRMSYWAYKNWVKKNGEEKLLPGLNKTNEQLLFVSFAQMWCSSYNPQEAYRMTMIDTHTLAKYRVIGALSNMKEFSDAFNCPAGTKMNPEKKCHVW